MGYCFMTIKKLKTMSALVRAYGHNIREFEVENADKSRSNQNEVLKEIDGTDICDAWEHRKDKLPYYEYTKLRKTSSPALEILLAVPESDKENLDLEKWKAANMKWLKDTFDVADDKYGSNLLSVVYHGDENNAHIHAIITPVDERGHFYTDRWMGGRGELGKLQTEYAKAMEPLGLERGLQRSKMKHKDIARLYAEIDRTQGAVQRICEIRDGENLNNYKDRIQESFLDRESAMIKIMGDYKREKEIAETKLSNFEMQYSKVFTPDEQARIEHALQKTLPKERDTWEGIEREYGSLKNIKKLLDNQKLLNDGIENFPDRNKANILNDNINNMMQWQKLYEKEHEKDRKNRDIQSRNEQRESELQDKAAQIEHELFGD